MNVVLSLRCARPRPATLLLAPSLTALHGCASLDGADDGEALAEVTCEPGAQTRPDGALDAATPKPAEAAPDASATTPRTVAIKSVTAMGQCEAVLDASDES